MATASVMINFEVASSDDAKAQVSTWNLPEGSQVSITITEATSSGTINSSGELVEPVFEVPAMSEVPNEPAS